MAEDRSSGPAAVTELLTEWSQGSDAALEQLVSTVYPELRRLARGALRRERPGHTLQPTALINELYLRLVHQHSASWVNRSHFFAVAAKMMRRILVDHARAHATTKRGAEALRLTLSAAINVGVEPALEVLAIDRALDKLAKLDPEQARIVELKFLSGLTTEEAAQVLNRSPRTIEREWRVAKAWLHGQLAPERA